MTEVVAEGAPLADVHIPPAEDVEVDAPEGTPMSPLALLKGKRAALMAKLHKDLAVPRWEDILGRVVWIRYGPANVALWTAAQQKRQANHLAAKKKGQPGDPDWAIKANADMLVDACRGVYFLEPGEKPPEGELPADLPTFGDPELAAVLDIQPGNAVRTALAIYASGGDLVLAADALLGWSGEASKEAGEAFLTS